MSQSIHIFAKTLPVPGPTDGRCLPCSGVSWRALSVSPCFSHGCYKSLSQIKIVSLRCTTRSVSTICNASSGSHRRNPDVSRQNKHGFSRNRNRQYEEKDGTENFEDSELFSSKNGPLFSVSGTPKFQATATPGQREKEIVELFKKVQAQLRDRAAIKEEKKVEDHQVKNKESETVDSLLKLLRKHSIQQEKRKGRDSGNSNSDIFMEQPDQTSTSSEVGSSNTIKLEAHDVEIPPVSRPKSNFHRRSPVRPVKFQPVFYDDGDNITSVTNTNLVVDKRELNAEHELVSNSKFQYGIKPDMDREPTFTEGEVFDEMSEDEDFDDEEEDGQIEHRELSEMKLPELRALAKSRGLKGFSKLKKGELVELLSGE